MSENKLLDAALHYAVDFGWPVLPCKPNKDPYTPNGFYDAKTDPNAIKFWWTKWPDAMIGVRTGPASGLIVIDKDIDDEKGKDGPAEVRAWERESGYTLPETVTAVSGRGGEHLYYIYPPEGLENDSCREFILPDVDIRGDKGYIIAPPSVHPNGKEYFWDISPDDMPVTVADDSVKAFLSIDAKKKPKKTKTSNPGDPSDGPSERMKVPKVIPHGTRNRTLFRLACKMQADGFPDDAILAAIQQTNENACEEPIDDKELVKLVDSALRYEKGGIFIDYGTQAAQPAAQPAQPAPGGPPEMAIQDPGAPIKFTDVISARDLLAKDVPEPIAYVGVGEEVPLLCEGTCILSAKPKCGKSWLALALCIAVANGEDFLGYHTKRCRTLYLDLESDESIRRKRLVKAVQGHEVPDSFDFIGTSRTLGNGLLQQIENYLTDFPDTGLIVVDVFEKIRTAAINLKESDYSHAYRDLTPLNYLAAQHHISIIVVSHNRKAIDPEDPFANILGSTGLQAAVTQMIVLQKRRSEGIIQLFAQGRTLDGEIELGTKLDAGQWSVIAGANSAEREKERLAQEYMESPIRAGVLALMQDYSIWKGRCSSIIDEAVQRGIPITDTAKAVGGFLHKHQGRMLETDGIKLQIIQRGTASKTYKLSHIDADTEPDEMALPAGFIDMGYDKPEL